MKSRDGFSMRDGSAPFWERFDYLLLAIKLFVVILTAVFVCDLLENWLNPLWAPYLSFLPRQFYDPIITTLFVSPALWWILFRPLRSFALDEKAKYEAVKAQVVDAIITINDDGVIISFNAAAEKIFGYGAQEIIGKNAAVLFCDESLSVLNLKAIVGNGGGDSQNIDSLCCYTKNGEELKLEISVSHLMISGTLQFLVIMRNITRRALLEKEAKEAQSRLIQINKMTSLGLMVSGLAHEINNPNNYILANAQLLERVCSDVIKVLQEYNSENNDFVIAGMSFQTMEKSLPEMVSGIIDGSQRITEIIDEVKVFYRSDRVNVLTEFDLNSSVNAAVSLLRTQIALKTRNFKVALGDNLPKVKGNSHHIGQVVINILMNACQSLRSEEGAIRVETFCDSAASEVVISVSDEGIGIRADDAKHIKEAFYSTKSESGGTGLGLSISDAIIKEHKGTLTFKSEPGVGTTFQIRLPYLKQ